MRINHNISAMVTQGSLYKANVSMSKSLEKLSTGLRINRASDDAAGLGVSENLRTQVRGLGQALKNTQDVISMLNIADGALNEQAEILQRMRELVIQARNDTYTATERAYMGQEFSALVDEIDRIAATATYNGMKLFATPELNRGTTIYTDNTRIAQTPHEASLAKDVFDDPEDSVLGAGDHGSGHHFNMMIGANYSAEDMAAYTAGLQESWEKTADNLVTVQLAQMDSNAMFGQWPDAGLDGSDYINTVGQNAFGWDPVNDMEDMFIDLTFQATRGRSATIQDKFSYLQAFVSGGDADGVIMEFNGTTENPMGLERVNQMRAYIGAMTNRLEHSANNTMNQINNQQAAESIIRDVDFAAESTNLSKNSILTQSATAMLAQANMRSQSVLQLIQ